MTTRVLDRDRREQVADARALELREQPEDRERRVEVDVDRVVEGVVDAFEQREPADVVGLRLRPADLTGLPERPAVDQEVQLVEQRRACTRRAAPGRRGSAAATPRSRRARPASPRGRGGEVPGARAGPAPVPRVALPPSPTGPELDHRQVPGEREPDRPALAGSEAVVAATAAPAGPAAGDSARAGGAASRRPSVAKSVHSSVSASGSNAARAVTSQPSAASAASANVPRSAVGAPAPGRGGCRHAAALGDDLVRPTGRRPVRGATRRVRPGGISPTVSGLGPRVLDPPLEDADGQRAPLEVAGDHRRQLLADEAHPDHLGLECLPRPREQRVVRPAAHRQVPAPGREHIVRRSKGGQDGRPPCRPVHRRTARTRRPRPARTVPPDLEVPARDVAAERAPDAPRPQPADRDARPLAVVDHRAGHPRPADRRHGDADPAAPRHVGDGRPRRCRAPVVRRPSTVISRRR